MTDTQTPLDQFTLEMHRATERHAAVPVAVALSPLHSVAVGLPPSIMGLATCYDTSLSVQQGPIFFDTIPAFMRYAAKVNP